MTTRTVAFWFAWFCLLIDSSLGATPLWSDVCTQAPVRSMPFCNTALGMEERVADYTQRIPAEDQIAMMNHAAAGYEPLQIPPYQWWSEGLHGPLEDCVESQNQCVCPTSFPCPSALGTAFNTSLYHQIGVAIGKEGRAISNLRPHDMGIGDGLTYWSPTINMQRDPRWGRNQEGI
jgi:beta-glucosidase-like glycosyl hydrolase